MSYTKLLYHIVTGTKDREPYLEGDIEDHAYACLRASAKDAGGEIMFIGGIEDHVHAIASIHQSVAVADLIRDIKTVSSKAIHREFPNLGFSWQIGFGAFTVSHYDMGSVVSNVLNQKKHHAVKASRATFERMS
jgi:REP element-mobilizing transposase RayT